MKNRNVAKTQLQNHFATAVHADVRRSVLMRNNTHKTTFNCGDLVPVYVDEVLPGDTMEMSMSFISRLVTPIFPTMDVLDLDFYAFFCPNRLVWDGWEELMGENKTSAWTPATPPALVPATVSYTGLVQVGTIGDYFGLPVGVAPASYGGAIILPFRMYGLIYNEWFRDQNLQAPIIIDKGNTATTGRRYNPIQPLFKVNKKHDLFTSCLPAPQKGESSLIPIELNDLIPVVTGGLDMVADSGIGNPLLWTKTSDGSRYTGDGNLGTALGLTAGLSGSTNNQNVLKPRNLFADGRFMRLNATTISELRTAIQIQKLYERDARGGTRYIEMLKAHFGVDAQDYRLQRPEFLGHYHSYVGVQQVPQTSSTDSVSPQGNLAAFSYTEGRGISLFKKSFVEHGFLFVFAVARQRKTYHQGLPRMFSRRERLDFYMPVLAHISEQPILNKEIFASSNSAQNDEVFGYNEAWAQYRYKPNQVTGQFRPGVANSLDAWHYADHYSELPILSAGWIEDNSKENVDRTLAVQSSLHNQIMMDIAFQNKSTRPMPVHSIPGFVDHF